MGFKQKEAWEPEKGFRQGLQKTIERHENNGLGEK